MEYYAIFRRNAFEASELEAVDARSNTELDRRADHVRKIRSYVLDEEDGRVGTVCLYQADSPEAIHAHAEAADLPVDEIVRIGGIDVHRADPDKG